MSQFHLCLTVEAAPGADINEVFKEACLLARHINLAYVKFDFNGMDCTCFPDWTGYGTEDSERVGLKKVGEWSLAGGWEDVYE